MGRQNRALAPVLVSRHSPFYKRRTLHGPQVVQSMPSLAAWFSWSKVTAPSFAGSALARGSVSLDVGWLVLLSSWLASCCLRTGAKNGAKSAEADRYSGSL